MIEKHLSPHYVFPWVVLTQAPVLSALILPRSVLQHNKVMAEHTTKGAARSIFIVSHQERGPDLFLPFAL